MDPPTLATKAPLEVAHRALAATIALAAGPLAAVATIVSMEVVSTGVFPALAEGRLAVATMVLAEVFPALAVATAVKAFLGIDQTHHLGLVHVLGNSPQTPFPPRGAVSPRASYAGRTGLS